MFSFYPYQVAQEFLENDRPDETIGLLSVLSSVSPDFKNMAALGDALYYSDFRREALPYYEKALTLLPEEKNDLQTHLTYLSVLLQLSAINIFLRQNKIASQYLEKAEPLLNLYIDHELIVLFHFYRALNFALEEDLPKCNEYAAKAGQILGSIKTAKSFNYWQFHLLAHHLLSECDRSNLLAIRFALRALQIRTPTPLNEGAKDFIQAYANSEYNIINLPAKERAKIKLFSFQERFDAVDAIFEKDGERSGRVLRDILQFYNLADEIGSQTNEQIYQRFSALQNNVFPDNTFEFAAHSLREIVFDLFIGNYAIAFDSLSDLLWEENMDLEKAGLLLPFNLRRHWQQHSEKSSALLLSIMLRLPPDQRRITRTYNILLRRKSFDAEIDRIFYKELKSIEDQKIKFKVKQWEWLNHTLLLNALKSIRGPEGAVAFRQLELQYMRFMQDNPEIRAQLSEGPNRVDLFSNGAQRAAWMATTMYNQQNDVLVRDRTEHELRKLLLDEMQLSSMSDAEYRAIAGELPEDTCVLEFFRSIVIDCSAGAPPATMTTALEYYYCIVVLPGEQGLHFQKLGEASTIDNAISDYRAFITEENDRIITKSRGSNPQARDKTNAGPIQILTEKLLLPLEEIIINFSHLFVAAEGELLRLPFQILKTTKNEYLIDTKTITYIGSGRDVLQHMTEKSTEAPVLITEPMFSLEELTERNSQKKQDQIPYGQLFFQSLPYSQHERTALNKIFSFKVLEKGDASVANVKELKRPRFLHISTHGIYLSNYDASKASQKEIMEKQQEQGWIKEMGLENPMYRSLLALAGANDWLLGRNLPEEYLPGFITAHDFGKLDLTGTDMVVLSACETGLGDIETGAGVMGLRLGVKISGAASLIASLWKVPDRQTAALIEQFYLELATGKDKSEALRAAQLKLRETNEDPLFWGAFIHEQYSSNRSPIANLPNNKGNEPEKGIVTTVADLYTYCAENHLAFMFDPAFQILAKPTSPAIIGARFAVSFEGTELQYAFEPVKLNYNTDSELYFRKKAMVVTGSDRVNVGNHPPAATKLDFNADWSASCLIPVRQFSAPQYVSGMFTGIYKEKKGWIWILILLTSVEMIKVQKSITLAYNAIKFV